MKKQLIIATVILIFLCMLGTIWWVYNEREEERKARMTMGEAYIELMEDNHDFGNIDSESGIVSHDFEFINTGISPLVITDVSILCNCVKVDYNKRPIKPGKKGRITVGIDPKAKSDLFIQTVKVFSNAKNSCIQVTITGNVVRKQII